MAAAPIRPGGLALVSAAPSWGASQDQRPSSTGIADEMAWRENYRRPPNGDHLISSSPPRSRTPRVLYGLVTRIGRNRHDRSEGHVVTANALVAKRAEILFEIGELEKQADRFAPSSSTWTRFSACSAQTLRPKDSIRHRRPTKSPYFAHGELTKRIFDAMRERGTVTSQEIAAAAMRDKGLDPDADRATRADFVRRVTLQLNDMLRKGKVKKIGRGRGIIWSLASATTSQSG